MLGMESSPETLGAKLTVLKEGGGGRTGRVSMMVTRFRATLLLLGTFRVELELGGRGSLVLLTSLCSSLLREARVFLGQLRVRHQVGHEISNCDVGHCSSIQLIVSFIIDSLMSDCVPRQGGEMPFLRV